MDSVRMKQLRRVVEAAPEDRFEMKNFCTESSCGTAYCAAGWAALDPWFQENTDILDIFDVEVIGSLAYVKEAHDNTFSRLQLMFGLSAVEADDLFGGELHRLSPPVPKSFVLENIDSILAGDPTIPYASDEDDDD